MNDKLRAERLAKGEDGYSDCSFPMREMLSDQICLSSTYLQIEDAFGPVKDWYEGENSERSLAEMVGDAVSDLIVDRELANKYRGLEK